MARQSFSTTLQAAQFSEDGSMVTGAIIAEIINPKDYRNIQIDQAFISDFVSLAAKKPVPMYYGHSWYSATGKKVAFINNNRTDGSSLVGDITFLESAKISPTLAPGTVDYLQAAIKESAHAIMLSMSVDVEYFFAKTDGKKVVENYDWRTGTYSWTQEGTNAIYDGIVHMKLQGISSVDFVDEGALTNSVFSSQSDEAFIEQFNHMCKEQSAAIIRNYDKLSIPEPMSTKKSFFQNLKSIFEMENIQDPVVTEQVVTEAAAVVTPQAEFATKADLAAIHETLKQFIASQTHAAVAAPEQVEFAGANIGAAPASGAEITPIYLTSEINKRAFQVQQAKQA